MSTTHTILRLFWGGALLVFAFVWISIVCVLGMIISPFLRLATGDPHIGKRIFVPIFSWGIVVAYGFAGIRYTIDRSEFSGFPEGEPGIMAMLHPSTLGMMPLSRIFGPRWKFGIKKVLRWWPLGWGAIGTRAGFYIDRRNSSAASRSIREEVQKGHDTVFAFFLDGTRPKRSAILDGRIFLRSNGFRSLADQLRYGAAPRVRGLYELVRAAPNVKIALMLNTSSRHEEGFRGVIEMLFAGELTYKLIDWDITVPTWPELSWDQLSPEQKRQVQQAVYPYWCTDVQIWIEDTRIDPTPPFEEGDEQAYGAFKAGGISLKTPRLELPE